MANRIPKGNAKHGKKEAFRVHEYKDADKLNSSRRSKKRSNSSKQKIGAADSLVDNERELSEEIKKEFLKELEEESSKNKIANAQISRAKSAVKFNQNVQSSEPEDRPVPRAPGVQQIRGSSSAYIKNAQKNHFFARTLRYQAHIPEVIPKAKRNLKSASQSRLASQISKEETYKRTEANPKSNQGTSSRPATASAASASQDFKITSDTKQISKSRYQKLMMLGTRPTFSKEYVSNSSSNVINKTNVYPQYKSDDFLLPYDDVLPNEEEGLTHLSRIELLKKDGKNGHEIENLLKVLRESKALATNFELMRETYYIHKNRDEKLRIPEKVIGHSEALRMAKQLFPNKDYTGKDMDEFAMLYDSINTHEEIPNFSMQELEEKLRDANITDDERKRLESLLMLIKHSRKSEPEKNENLRKKWVQKEFERRQHEAILAGHFSRIQEFYKDKNYGAYAKNLKKKNFGGTIMKKELNDEQQKQLTYERNAKQIARGIINETNFEAARFAKMLRERENTKKNATYAPSPQFMISDDTEQLYPGIRDRFEKFKARRFDGWNFEEEVDKARIRWYEENLVSCSNARIAWPNERTPRTTQRSSRSMLPKPRSSSAASRQR